MEEFTPMLFKKSFALLAPTVSFTKIRSYSNGSVSHDNNKGNINI